MTVVYIFIIYFIFYLTQRGRVTWKSEFHDIPQSLHANIGGGGPILRQDRFLTDPSQLAIQQSFHTWTRLLPDIPTALLITP